MKFSVIRPVLAADAALPLLVRTSRMPGYYAVVAVSAVMRQSDRLLPEPDFVVENWLELALAPHSALGNAAVSPAPSWELPDLSGLMLASALADIDYVYDDFQVAVSSPVWTGVCRDTYRRSVMIESTGKQALVFHFDL